MYVMLNVEINLCYVILFYVMLCYVMLCYVMLCYVMLCYVMYGNIYSTLIRKNMFIKLNPCFCRRYMYTNSYRKTSVTIE